MSFVFNANRLGLLAFAAVAVFVALALVLPQTTSADVATYPFKLTKSISDNYTPDPYTADEFKFNVSGYGLVSLDAFTNDTAEKIIYLTAGTHTVEEVGPAGFIPADWTLQWSGPGCETPDDGNGPVRPIQITVVPTSVDYPGADDVGNACKADNQWRGDENNNDVPGCMDDSYDNYNPNATVDDGSCANDGDGETGTIIITKQTLPDGNQTSFAFNPSWSDENFSLSDGGQHTTSGLAPGVYNVDEFVPVNWTQTSVVCSDGSTLAALSLQADETITCTVTNTYNNGGGDNDPKTYLVYGYVWHDENSNTNWEMDDPETEVVETMEVDLDGWTVTITNGSVTYSTVTDAAGYYFFYVPVGVWTISETLQTEWNQTAPTANSGTHIVNVGGEVVVTMDEVNGLLATLWSYVVPTAYAQAATTYGPYNFGNVFFGTGGCGSNCGGGGGNGGNNDDDRRGGSSGTRTNRSNGGGATPTVLGDATTTMPVGAPDTGAGGASVPFTHVPVLVIAVSAQVRTRKNA